MSSMQKAAIVTIAAFFLAPSAIANDSSAEFATGGLIFVRNDNVEMRSEELTISAEQVTLGALQCSNGAISSASSM
jgi:hypothetical protein